MTNGAVPKIEGLDSLCFPSENQSGTRQNALLQQCLHVKGSASPVQYLCKISSHPFAPVSYLPGEQYSSYTWTTDISSTTFERLSWTSGRGYIYEGVNSVNLHFGYNYVVTAEGAEINLR